MTLGEQLLTPPILFALSFYGILSLVSLDSLLWCGPLRCRLAFLGVALTVFVSLIHWRSTPPGVIQDTWDYIPRWKGGIVSTWDGYHTYPWVPQLPTYIAWMLSGTWLAERAVGLAWHCLAVVALVTLLTACNSPSVVNCDTPTYQAWLEKKPNCPPMQCSEDDLAAWRAKNPCEQGR